MSKTRLMLSVTLLMALAAGSAQATVIITEFQASNDSFMFDENGQLAAEGSTPDWIELFNTGAEEVNLAGWALTDDPDDLDKWVFPEVLLGPGQFLIVFASGDDLRDPAGPLHTGFRLSSGGEALVLVKPGPEVVPPFFAEYPPQMTNRSYGFPMTQNVDTVVGSGSEARYFVPDNNDLEQTWVEREFDDSTWDSGPLGLGYDANDEPVYEEGLISTDVGPVLHDEETSIYVRVPFMLEEADFDRLLQLKVKYDDGFVCWVNGVYAGERNLREPIRDSSRAQARREPSEAAVWDYLSLAGVREALRVGENVIAFQGLNTSRRNDEFLLHPVLELIDITGVETGTPRFYEHPSPGRPNDEGSAGVSVAPSFSRESGAVLEAFELSMTAPGDGTEIRYTTDGAEPTAGSTLYTGPIMVDTVLTIRARAFQPGLLSSPTVTSSYVFIDDSLADTTSNLPLVVINTFGRTLAGGCDKNQLPIHIHIIERGEDGEAHMTAPAIYSGNAAARDRGSSTCGRTKQSWNIEFQDDQGEDLDAEVFGWDAESDYVLYGAFNFDQAHMRNAFAYNISNQVGRWAPKTQFVEVYLNQGRGPVSQNGYWGVYSFMEKIKKGENRVDVETLNPEHDSEPEISGGYIFKIDRSNDPGDITVSAAGAGNVVMEYPKEPTSAQRSWLSRHLGQMNSALRRSDPLEMGREFIDVDSWIDHHILMTFPKNVDAFRLSGYLHLNRNGLVSRGPVWDYDRSMQSTDGRDDNPRAWANSGGDGGTRYFTNDWYGALFKGRSVDAAGPPPLGNDEWATRYRDRWRELREGALSTENLVSVIDGMAAEIGAAADRDWSRWRQGPRDYSSRVATLRNWITTRVQWIDSQFVEPPVFSEEGGPRSEPFELELSTTNGTVWYTVNGPDPARTNGRPADEAVEYTGPIMITENTRIWARSRISERVWSEGVSNSYVFSLMPLVVTEIMYNPPEPANEELRSWDHEFIEFKNVGTEPIDLTGVRLADRFSHDFSIGPITTLGPGEYGVIVHNPEAFTEKYGEGIPILGAFENRLSNNRTRLTLVGPVDEVLLDFQYDDDWHPTTDGDGYSLVIKDPTADPSTWDEGDSWMPSPEIGGSPGRGDGDEPEGGLRRAGDINGDGSLNVSDASALLGFLFRASPSSLPCGDGTLDSQGNVALADSNGDQMVNLADGVHLLIYLFQAGDAPALGAGCVRITGCDDSCAQ